jgi:hypothetical protein
MDDLFGVKEASVAVAPAARRHLVPLPARGARSGDRGKMAGRTFLSGRRPAASPLTSCHPKPQTSHLKPCLTPPLGGSDTPVGHSLFGDKSVPATSWQPQTPNYKPQTFSSPGYGLLATGYLLGVVQNIIGANDIMTGVRESWAGVLELKTWPGTG